MMMPNDTTQPRVMTAGLLWLLLSWSATPAVGMDNPVRAAALLLPLERVPESIGTYVFYVHLGRPAFDRAAHVTIKLQPLSAVPGEDYVPLQTMAFFAPGQILAPVPVAIIDNDAIDGDRSFRIQLADPSPWLAITHPHGVVTLMDDDEPKEATCRFDGVQIYEDGRYPFSGSATIDDQREQLLLVPERGSRLTVDIADLGIGERTGTFNTGANDGRYRVEVEVQINADPAGVAAWQEMDGRERMASATGLPDRLARRRLKGELRAKWSGSSGSGAREILAEFDAGNGPYHCEGGLEAQQNAVDAIRQMLRDN